MLVPLGRRLVTGCVTAHADAPPPGLSEVRDVADLLDDTPFLPEPVLDLALWVAGYYLAGPGEAVAAAMPPLAWLESERRYRLIETASAAAVTDPLQHRIVASLRRSGAARPASALRVRAEDRSAVESALRALERQGLVERVLAVRGRASAFKVQTIAAITPGGLAVTALLEEGRGTPAVHRLTVLQAETLRRLAGVPEGLSSAALQQDGIRLATLRRLAARGLVAVRQERLERDPWEAASVEPPPLRELTSEQQDATARLERLLDCGAFRAAVLHGVTGSGKTEIYLRLAARAVAQGRRTLVLVPEIALTPQVARQFRAAFGARVAIQHSALAAGERHDQWHRIRRGEIDVVVGTRSAVFAPLDRLGLIVVDEEHDTSYKQEESPRYHGRDVAVLRGQRAGALVVLGSATPSLESYENSERGRYERVVLARRVLDRPLARVRVVDLREEYAEVGPDVVLSRSLQAAVADRLARGEQTLLLLNRRGLATAVFCRQCGHILDCRNCSVSLTVHATRHGRARALCHYCGYTMGVPTTCVRCAAPYLEQAGFGTARVQEEVARLFPGIRAARVDRDTMVRRGAVERILGAFSRQEVDLLVGTQMIAKGHDFPKVTLVGVVSADMGLGLADFRAAERTFQLLTQVVGRAGRGERSGEALVQTIHPEHYSIRLACDQDYAAFFLEERRYRAALRYPPVVTLVNVVVRQPSLSEALLRAADLAERLRRAAGNRFGVLGPAPAPLTRLRGEYRAQLFLKGRNRRLMREALAEALQASGDQRRRITVDVDPIGML